MNHPPSGVPLRSVASARDAVRRIVGQPIPQAALVGVLVVLAHLLFRIDDLILMGAFNDDAVYITLGKALASGEGFRSIHIPGEPVQVKYPPGVPLLFALFWMVGGGVNAVVRIATTTNLVALAAASATLWWIARTQLHLRPAVAAPFVVGPFLFESTILYYDLAISEPYFMLGWAGVLAMYLALRRGGSTRRQVGLAVGVGILLAVATLVRTQAAALIVGVVVVAFYERVKPAVVGAMLASSVLPIVMWRMWQAQLVASGPVSTLPDETPYLTWLPWGEPLSLAAAVVSVLLRNLTIYRIILTAVFSDVAALGVLLLVALGIATIVGGVLLAKRHPIIVVTAVLSVAAIVLWPYTQDRLLLSSLPFVGLLTGAAVQAAWRAERRGLSVAVRVSLLVAIGSITLRQLNLRQYAYTTEAPTEEVELNQPGYYLTVNSRYLVTIAPWILENTDVSDRILVDFAAGVYLYTGRQAVSSRPSQSFIAPSVFEEPGDFLARRILEDSVTVVTVAIESELEETEGRLVGSLAPEIAAFIDECPGILEYLGVARRWSQAGFFRVHRDGNQACIMRLRRPS